MGGAVLPSHVGSGYVHPNAPDLMGVTTIDTDTLAINGMTATNFVRDSSTQLAVLSVHNWTVDQNVTVTGSRPLVVVASGFVDVKKAIQATATLAAGGPGAVSGGSGAGHDGTTDTGQSASSFADSGGAGGSYGGLGAAGGSATDTQNTNDMGANIVVPGGAVGSLYGGQSPLQGGAQGGNGSGAGGCNSTGTNAKGGSGGGAVQITSTMAITIESSGVLNVGGGGGGGGCIDDVSGGGGGGSGGELFLEAPAVTVSGKLLAAGGGGGSGANPSSDGANGDDAAAHNDGHVAKGGAAMGNASAGGDGAAAIPATTPAMATMGPNLTANAGGGGGGLGRIYLRTRGNAANKSGSTLIGVEVDDTGL